ncbi:RNA methyltransferase [Desulfomarina sp.]
MYRGETSLHIALIHHPVLNKKGDIIGSAVTNLDLHDIARVARTYGVSRYYIVTPFPDQQNLIREMLDHWLTGHGGRYNPARKEALHIVRVADNLETVQESIRKRFNRKPLLVCTSAREQNCPVSYSEVRQEINKKYPVILLFGTAHGLAPELLQLADHVLPPIAGAADYNHLSVRSAASIVIDRLLGAE